MSQYFDKDEFNFMKKTFRSKIILVNTLSVVLALVISSSYLLTSFFNITRDNTIDMVELNINNSVDQYNEEIDDLYNLSYSLIASPVIRKWFENNIEISIDGDKNLEFFNDLKDESDGVLMFNNTWKNKVIKNIVFLWDDYSINLAQRLPGVGNDINESIGNVYRLTKSIKTSKFYYRNGPNIYFIQRVFNNTISDEVTFIYEINTDVFLDKLDAIPSQMELNVKFYDSPLYFSSSTNLSEGISTKFLNVIFPNAGFTLTKSLDETPIGFELTVPPSYINQQIVSTLNRILIVSIIILILLSIFSVLISSTATKFIVYLIDAINEIRVHKMGTTLKKNKNEDLNEIVDAFNSMSLELQTLIDNGYKQDVLLLQSDIRQLQSQMNPHFLINSIASIATNSLINGDEKTYEMLIALSTVLTKSMFNTKDNSPLIQLKDEMEYIRGYLKIQKFRFEDKIEIKMDVDDSLYSLYVPRLSVEPLVENAVTHGIEDRIEKGIITLCIKEQDNNLIITVSDNGKILERELHNDISATKSHHIALNNTNSRIHLLFGDDYGIIYNFDNPFLTVAELTLPVIRDKKKTREELIYV
jgi:two-component system sensor histidine kinase YesM